MWQYYWSKYTVSVDNLGPPGSQTTITEPGVPPFHTHIQPACSYTFSFAHTLRERNLRKHSLVRVLGSEGWWVVSPLTTPSPLHSPEQNPALIYCFRNLRKSKILTTDLYYCCFKGLQCFSFFVLGPNTIDSLAFNAMIEIFNVFPPPTTIFRIVHLKLVVKTIQCCNSASDSE